MTGASDAGDKATEALAIAKGKNQAHVFATTEAMQTALADEDNKGAWQVGDNLYIEDLNVPDWWIAEVLEEVDPDTGYFYRIAQLETQKVDLTEINDAIDAVENDLTEFKTSPLSPSATLATDIDALYWHSELVITDNTTEGTFPEGFDKRGIIEVVIRSTNRVFHRYTDINGNSAVRCSTSSGVWADWDITAKQADVDDINTKLSDTILPQYKNYVFPATGWYRVAEVNSNYQYLIDLQLVRTFGNTPPESHKISITNTSGFKFLNEISAAQGIMHPKVRVTMDNSTKKQYIEVYYDHKSDGNNTVIMLSNQANTRPEQWLLVDAVSTEETVEGITVIGTHEFSANKSYESEIANVNTNLGKIRYMEFSRILGDESTHQPWLEIEAQIDKFEIGMNYFGQINCGTAWVISGKRIEVGYASFIVHCYSGLSSYGDTYHVIQKNGTWFHYKLINERDIAVKMTESGANVLNITEHGRYYVINGASTPNVAGVRNFGYLDVLGHPSDTTYRTLEYIPYDSNVRYQNIMTNGTWSGWDKLVTQSDIDAINSRLAYKDISSSIDVGDTGCTASGYVENGMVVIKIIIPAGTTGQSLLSIDSSYTPRFTINGNVGELSSMSDLIKIGGYINGVGLIYINYTASLAATSTITFTYPLKTS